MKSFDVFGTIRFKTQNQTIKNENQAYYLEKFCSPFDNFLFDAAILL